MLAPSSYLASHKKCPCHLHDRDECIYPRYHPISGSCPQLSSLKQKDTFISIFHPLATSFDTFVDFSAPPLSVKCGFQNTSNSSIVARFFRKCKAQERLLELDTIFFNFLMVAGPIPFRARSSFSVQFLKSDADLIPSS